MTNPVLLMLLQKRRIASLEAALREIREHVSSCDCREEVEEIINRVLLPKSEMEKPNANQ
ncbi:MAG: hypothetical protein ACK2U5_02125 [Candidatus Promineifilaceae bacterium]|jgi:hypothetical protein